MRGPGRLGYSHARDTGRCTAAARAGDYAGDQALAAALGLPRPGPGEFVSARLASRETRDAGGWPTCGRRRVVRLGGAGWALAEPSDPPVAAPHLPRAQR